MVENILPEEQLGLTSSEQSELVGLILEEYRRGKSLQSSRRTVWSSCFDMYNGVFRTPLQQQETWIQKVRVFMPIVRTLVGTLKAAMVNFMLPNDKYIEVKADPVLDDFWTEVGLVNYQHTNFDINTQESVLQGALTGDNYNLIRQDGPYWESPSIPLSDIVILPLQKDIAGSTKIISFRMTEYELRSQAMEGRINYFNLEPLLDRDLKVQKHTRSATGNKNPLARTEAEALGEGFELLEAHINYHRFESGKEMTNVVATIVKEPLILIRLEPDDEDNITHNTWESTPPGVYYGTGVVEPTISPVNYVNTLMTAELVGQMLDSMGGFYYNPLDEDTRRFLKAGKMVRRPGGFIPRTPNSGIEAVESQARHPAGQEFFFLIKNELIEATNALTAFSGSGANAQTDPTATLTNIKFNASTGRAESVAKWWDKNYIVPITYRITKRIQKQLFQPMQDPMTGQPIQDPNTGQPVRMPNLELIQFWMNKIGWDMEKQFEMLNDPQFLQALSQDVEMSMIEPTGTQTVVNKIEEQQAFSASVAEIRPEESPFIKWSDVSRERFKRFGVKDVDAFVMTNEEIQLAAQQMQGQVNAQNEQMAQQANELQGILESGVNPETGQPLSEEEVKQIQAQIDELAGGAE